MSSPGPPFGVEVLAVTPDAPDDAERLAHAVMPPHGRRLRLTLSDGRVIERDVSDLLRGPVFERIASSDEAFAEVTVANGTATWLKDGADIAPETLIWNGPESPEGSPAIPSTTLIVTSPARPRT